MPLTSFSTFLGRCIYFSLIFCCSCNNSEERKVQRFFYYFKTVFDLSSNELEALSQSKVDHLYVKFFDVDWNEVNATVEPVAKAIFQQQPPKNLRITPVVFITQESLQKLDTQALNTLAANIHKLLSDLAANNDLLLSNEIQLDCDWTPKTKQKYFHLLSQLKKQPFFQNKTVSATIRLHQLKFVSQNGIPPVDKGLLMCYNMGNLRLPQTRNSIIDEDELKKYISNLDRYPLPLDVALPIFDWWVLFEEMQYKGLLRDFDIPQSWKHQQQIRFNKDTLVSGISFRAGQWLRHETSEPSVIKKCIEQVSKKLKAKELTVILYHLHEDNLSKYDQNDLESFFNGFR